MKNIVHEVCKHLKLEVDEPFKVKYKEGIFRINEFQGIQRIDKQFGFLPTHRVSFEDLILGHYEIIKLDEESYDG